MAGLQRRLYRIDALAIALGSVIGVGVFRNTGVVLSGSGGLFGATAVWLVVGVVCLAGAVLYADLSARVPEAGGPYAYVRVGFGRPAAFVYGWINGGLAMPVRQASVVAFAGEVLASWLSGGQRLWSILVLVALAAINLLGVRAGAITQRVFTAGKLGTIGLLLVLSLILIARGAPGSTAAITEVSFAVAVSACWYTYLGWQDVVLLAEELHQPRRDLPAVLIGTVGFTMAIYLAVHFAVYFALGGSAEAYGTLPAPIIAGYILGGFGLSLLTALTFSSTLGGAAESMMVRPRIAMALARDGLAPAPIAAINAAGTPHGAILFHSIVALAFVLAGGYNALLPVLAFTQGFLGIFETASYFAVRSKRPELPTSRWHPWAPLVFIAANIALCVLTGLDSPRAILWSLGLLVVTALVYWLVRRISHKTALTRPS
jgi:APA family basic amino acid/polyamine antiporter